MSSAPRRLFAGVCTVALLVLGFQLFGTTSADAHDNAVVGNAQCANGTYTVTWTVTNDFKLAETVDATYFKPDGSSLSPSSAKIPATVGATATITQTGIPGTATSADLTVKGTWSDGYSTTNGNTLSLSGDCKPGKQPTAPTSANGACANYVVVKPTITIPSDNGVSYTVNGAPRGSGTYSVDAGQYKVVASSTTYTLSPPTQWTLNVTEVQGDCLTTVTPVNPTVAQSVCKAGSHTPTTPTVTVVDTDAINYTVKPSGALTAGKPVEVDAVATAGHRFDTVPAGWIKVDSTHATLTFTLDNAPDCTEKAVPVNPTVNNAVCQAGSHTPTTPTITLPADGSGITYAKSAGPYTAGGTATVTATLQDGYKWGTLPDGWTVSPTDATQALVTVTFADAPDCREATTPVAPTVTQAICPATGTTPVAASVTVPADTTEVHYSVSAAPYDDTHPATVTATAQDGYKFADRLADGWTRVSDTTATYAVTFDAAPTCVVPANPDVTQSACAATGTTPVPATVTLATTPGIEYSVTAGPYDDTHPATVTATIQPGYQFDSGSLPGWTYSADGSSATYTVTFDATPKCAETVTPGFSNDECKSFVPTTATYTIPNTTGVDYYVDSVLTAPGTYTATDGSSVTVVAKPQSGYTIVGTSSWSHTFTVTPTCTESQQAAKATFSVQQCVSGKTLKPGTYTVPSSTGVDYLVNGVVVKSGTYTGKAGTTITVVAQAKPGYTLKGASRWTFAFDKAKQCSDVDSQSVTRPPSHSVSAETASRAPLASTGVHSSSLLTIGAGLLVLGAAITLLAGVSRRRRTDGPRH